MSEQPQQPPPPPGQYSRRATAESPPTVNTRQVNRRGSSRPANHRPANPPAPPPPGSRRRVSTRRAATVGSDPLATANTTARPVPARHAATGSIPAEEPPTGYHRWTRAARIVRGAPTIPPECCPSDRSCCDEHTPHVGRDRRSVRPGVRLRCTWTKVSCKCESSNADCCDEWDCGSSEGMCVPCKPCEGLIPEPTTPDDGGCEDPPPDGCSSDELRQQLEANKKCISAKQAEKAKLEADIKARQERDKELGALITDFDSDRREVQDRALQAELPRGLPERLPSRHVAQGASRTEFPSECLDSDGRRRSTRQLCAIEKAQVLPEEPRMEAGQGHTPDRGSRRTPRRRGRAPRTRSTQIKDLAEVDRRSVHRAREAQGPDRRRP